ncbi:tetratricopeptide repeat protein [Hydrogenovibrio sp.]|uniref:tetratricopeptide repeat protein n=1 Tax=Hydrogenovibrio sp. TaxID=2065821 RepID=UPI00287033F0|nr:tetratricopeptide repeat protein [Hydrogenovibrio sp.]
MLVETDPTDVSSKTASTSSPSEAPETVVSDAEKTVMASRDTSSDADSQTVSDKPTEQSRDGTALGVSGGTSKNAESDSVSAEQSQAKMANADKAGSGSESNDSTNNTVESQNHLAEQPKPKAEIEPPQQLAQVDEEPKPEPTKASSQASQTKMVTRSEPAPSSPPKPETERQSEPKAEAVSAPLEEETLEDVAPEKSAPVVQKAEHNPTTDYLFEVKRKVVAIKQAIEFDQPEEAETRLQELAELAGSDSVVYKKLRGYQYLSQQQYKKARGLYYSLLEDKPDDVEAVMNLIIVESELQDMESAKKRLKRLEYQMPQSKRIEQFAKNIRSQYGL